MKLDDLFLSLVCGGVIEITSHGTIATPGSPGNYPPNRDCIWKLNAPPNKRIQLHFFTLQIEAHEDCQYDYLAVISYANLNKKSKDSHPNVPSEFIYS